MIKITVLALFVALQGISAEKEAHGTSRRLLQAGGNPAGVQPGGGTTFYVQPHPHQPNYHQPQYYYPQQPYYHPQPQPQPQTYCGDICDPSPDNTCYDRHACWFEIQANQQANQQAAQPPAQTNPPPATTATPANPPPATNPGPVVVTPPVTPGSGSGSAPGTGPGPVVTPPVNPVNPGPGPVVVTPPVNPGPSQNQNPIPNVPPYPTFQQPGAPAVQPGGPGPAVQPGGQGFYPGGPVVQPGGAGPAVQPGGSGFYPGGPAALGPPLMQPLPEATCSGTTPMGTHAAPGSFFSCQNRAACDPSNPAKPCGPAGPMEFNNIAQNFKLYCDGSTVAAPIGPLGIPTGPPQGVCAHSEININIGATQNIGAAQNVGAINQLLFSEPFSGSGATVNVKNSQIGRVVEISALVCGTNGCPNLTVNMWGASMNDVDCPSMNDCRGCVINLYRTEPLFSNGYPLCPNPTGPQAIYNPHCLIESTPCFGY